MTAWPSWLPCALMRDYNYQRKDIVVRTEMDTGRTRMRQRFSNGPTIANVSWLMTKPQMAYFEGFFLSVLQGGSQPFNLPIKSGTGTEEHEVRFTGPYSATLASDYLFNVTAQLEVAELQVYDAATMAIIDEYGGDISYLGEFYDLLERHVNIELPASEMGA